MGSPPSSADRSVVGRGFELDELQAFLDDVREGPCGLILEGEAGIGKSIVWSAGVAAAQERRYVLATCRPASQETGLAYVALGDLLEDLPGDAFQELPGPLRRALDVALLREEASGTADRRAISVAVLTLLRSVASNGATILAVDDAQWLDGPSSAVLGFAIRRMTDEPIGILVTLRASSPIPLGLEEVFPDRVRRLTVGPLDPTELHAIVRSRLIQPLTPPTVRMLHEVSGGNPFFALEIARAVIRGDQAVTGRSLPVPASLRDDLIGHSIARLPVATREVLMIAAAASHPTVHLLQRALEGSSATPQLREAIDAGILEPHHEQVRFAHPLYRESIYAAAPRSRRHALHRRLADAVDDQDERARHLALAAEGPDDEVASALEDSAKRTLARGAPDAAADLYEVAARMTPSERKADLRRRRIEGARCHEASGDSERAAALLERLVDASPPGGERAEALWLFGRTVALGGDLPTALQRLAEALEEEHVPASIEGSILAESAMAEWFLGNMPDAAADATRAVSLLPTRGRAPDLAEEPTVRDVCRAIVSTARNDLRAASTAVERALRQQDRLRGFDLGRLLLLAGSLRRRMLQRRAARTTLEQSLECFETLSAEWWADVARTEMARISGRRPTGDLTAAEARVAKLAAAGRTNREIADALFMSSRTVEGHLSHVYSKLGVRSRTELVLFFDDTERPSHS